MKKNYIPKGFSPIAVLLHSKAEIQGYNVVYYTPPPMSFKDKDTPVETFEFDVDWLKARAWEEMEAMLPKDRKGMNALFAQISHAKRVFHNEKVDEYNNLVEGIFKIVRNL